MNDDDRLWSRTVEQGLDDGGQAAGQELDLPPIASAIVGSGSRVVTAVLEHCRTKCRRWGAIRIEHEGRMGDEDVRENERRFPTLALGFEPAERVEDFPSVRTK